jgi:hypothetical protein
MHRAAAELCGSSPPVRQQGTQVPGRRRRRAPRWPQRARPCRRRRAPASRAAAPCTRPEPPPRRLTATARARRRQARASALRRAASWRVRRERPRRRCRRDRSRSAARCPGGGPATLSARPTHTCARRSSPVTTRNRAQSGEASLPREFSGVLTEPGPWQPRGTPPPIRPEETKGRKMKGRRRGTGMRCGRCGR